MAVTWDEVVAFCLTLPEVTYGTSWNHPSLKAGKKLLTNLHEPGGMTIKLGSVDEQDHMVELDPNLYYINDHFKGWPGCLMRLDQADMDVVRGHVLRVYYQIATKRAIKAYEAGNAGT
ncbi:MAG: MmcQ/YjbR family DNA-binding protein [Alphaproteobacteria bacterium]